MSHLELNGLSLAYQGFSLSVDLSVNEGEFLTIIGPSGSGKSTVLSLIAGLREPSSGSMLIDGKDVTNLPAQKRGVSLVFQDYALFPSMNVEGNIGYAMKLRHVKRQQRQEEAKALLDFVHLPGYGKRKVNTLSGGEAQRVALARALSSRPSILLLDEPLSALDAALRRQMKDEIRRIHDAQPGLTTIYVTHDWEEAFSISDRIAIMMDGHIRMVGTPEEVYRKPDSLATALFTGEGTLLSASLFDLSIDADQVFFRPESVRLREHAWSNDSSAWLLLEGAEVVSAEFLGSRYLLGLSWKGLPLIAESPTRPSTRTVTASILKSALMFFKDGQAVNQVLVQSRCSGGNR